jgi:hypothetical protein
MESYVVFNVPEAAAATEFLIKCMTTVLDVGHGAVQIKAEANAPSKFWQDAS